MTRAILLSLLMTAACGPQKLAGAETTSGGSTTTTGTTESPTSTTRTTGTSSSSEAESSTSEPGSEDSWPGSPTDMGALDECDVFMQNCPAGQKCAPYAYDGGTVWNSAKCVPVVEDPAQVGEPCVAEGNGFSGFDDCAFGSFCFDVDEQNTGTCFAQCTGSPEAPACSPGFICYIYTNGVATPCLQLCDPLQQDCWEGYTCLATGGYHAFMCSPLRPEEGQLHEPCLYSNCDVGLFCADASAAEECDPEEMVGCCEPYCDVTLANTCPGVGQVCQPWFAPDEAPAGFEAVGFCAVPE